MEEKNIIHKKIFINTKKLLKEEVVVQKARIEQKAKMDMMHSAAYYHAVSSLFDRFLQKLDSVILFKELEPLWEYALSCSYEGIYLEIVHNEFLGVDNNGFELYDQDQSFVLFNIPAKYLTVEEYAQIYGVGVGTVRQWLRRGKIRTAKKYGNEWRISELSDPPRRGYIGASFSWENPLSFIPEEYSYLNEYEKISIMRNPGNQRYTVSLWKEGQEFPNTTFEIDESHREKLELYLIGNPEIHYVQDFYESIAADLGNTFSM